jgi:hypothetical protein
MDSIMNPDLTPLKTYIKSQRENGTSDEAITQSLLASGWQADMITRALADLNGNDQVQPIAQPEVQAAPVVAANANFTPGWVAPENGTQSIQPTVAQADGSDKNRKKVVLIGRIMIAFGVLAAIGGVFPDVNILALVFAAAQILVGVGILSYNKAAYTIFNILAILAILFGLFMLLGIPFMLLAVAISPSVTTILAALLYLVLSVGQLAFYIYGGIIFHKKEVRALFGKKVVQA